MGKKNRMRGEVKYSDFDGQQITYTKQMMVCAKSLGVKTTGLKASVLARLICKTAEWGMEDPRKIVERYCRHLVTAGQYKPVESRRTIAARQGIRPPTPKTRPVPKSAPPIKPLKPAYVRPECIPKLGAPHPDYVKDDDFYQSREWKEVRYFALVRAGGACQCCGAKASDGIQLHVDHIYPRYTHPHLSLDPNSLQCLCSDCNLGKGAWDSTDWRDHFKSI